MSCRPVDQAASAPECARRARDLVNDPELSAVHRWKAEHPGQPAIGSLPIYAPRELLDALGALPVGLTVTGDRRGTFRGDAWVQSYVCHLPRSILTLAESGKLDVLDGLIFPSTCDVVRNLRGVFQLRRPDVPSWYLELPHTPAVLPHFERQLRAMIRDLERITGRDLDIDRLRASIRMHNQRRGLLRRLDGLRAERTVSAVDLFYVVAAGELLPVEEHVQLLTSYIDHVQQDGPARKDDLRIVLRGCACEHPSPRLLSALERAGCALIDDDLLLGLRWMQHDVPEDAADPVAALASAALTGAPATPSMYDSDGRAAADAARRAKSRGAAVILAAPSFCDIALLDRPRTQRACEEAGVDSTTLEFSEDGSELRGLGEQIGTFADAVRLWRKS